jgi:hypothetical protein
VSLDSDRRLPEGARAAFFAKLFAVPGMEELEATPFRLSDKLLEKCERTIRLSHQNPDFRRHVADAVLIAFFVHKTPLVRGRKQLALIEKHARAAATELDRLANAIAEVGLSSEFFRLNIAVVIPGLIELAELVQEVLAKHKDRGGRRRMDGFSLFIRFLADAYGRATGRRAGITWNLNRYEGRF